MIKSLVIENFKVIKHLEIRFTPFAVLIGDNACGKSTVLQALDFIRALAVRDIDEYLGERGWLFDDLESQFADSDTQINFIVELTLNINGKQQDISWSIKTGYKDDNFIIEEKIVNLSKNEHVLNLASDIPLAAKNMKYLFLKSSFLKLIDENNPYAKYPEELYAVKKFFAQSSSYELLSPDRMREKGSRGEVKDIGMGGEMLAAYINKMSDIQRSKLDKMLSELIGYSAKTTTEARRPGWVDLFVNENFTQIQTKIKATHISDGLLRLLGLISSSLPKEENSQPKIFDALSDVGFILLDEIEDGISPYLVEKVIDLMRAVVADYNKQIIITTHSPVMLNHFEQDEIIFMWRDNAGQIHAKPMFATAEMVDTLDFLGPGEVWVNYTKESILEKLSSAQEKKHD